MTNRLSRVAVVSAVLVGLLLAAVAAAVVAAFASGTSIDASRWRDMVAQRASSALGRPVALGGVLQLTLGRELVLRVGELKVLNPPGFSGREFLTVGDARLRLDLVDALRARPRLRGIGADDIGLWLERDAEGRGNWVLAPPREARESPPAIDLGRVRLSRLAVHYGDARTAMQRAVVLDEVDGSAGPNDPLRLDLRGRAGGQWPYLLRVEGGSLQRLLDGRDRWPFKVDLGAAGASVRAGGELHAGRGEAWFRFDAHVADLADAGAKLGVRLPPAGAAALSAVVVARADAVEVGRIQGALGESAFAGQLALALGGARPRLSGSLSAQAFDLRPFIDTDPPEAGTAAEGRTRAWQAVALRDLVPLDVDLELRVCLWQGLPIGLRETTLGLHADEKGLKAPISATLADAEVGGELVLDTAAPTPTLALRLAGNGLTLGGLVRDLADVDGLDGRLAHAELRLGAGGATLGDLLRNVDLSLALTGVQASFTGGSAERSIPLAIDRLDLAVGPGRPLRGRARGSVMGERVRLSLQGGTWPDLLHARTAPVAIDIELAEAALRLQAAPAADAAARVGGVRFDLQARRSGDLARWLPVAPQSQLPVALSGRISRLPDAWQLDGTSLQVGRSVLRIDARRTVADGRPFTTATLRSPLIDAAELATLRPPAAPREGARSRLDAPILADAIDLGDADLDLELQHLKLGRADLVDVAFVARSRDGRLLPSTLEGKVVGTPFEAQVQLDLGAEAPTGKLELSTGEIDVGALLRALGLAEDIDGRVQGLEVALRGHGNTLRELAENTAIDARLVGGSLSVLGAAQRPIAEIRLKEALVGAAAGEPVRLRLDGTVDEVPVRIVLSTGSFADLAGDATRVPFSMVAQAAGARLGLDGEVGLPLGSDAKLNFEISGKRLDTLNALARVELPPWGPWSFGGPIRTTATGYELQGLALSVGSSRLVGSAALDLGGAKPRLQVQVAAPTVQLDDFPLPERLVDEPEPVGDGEGLRGSAARLAGRVDRMLGAGFLRRFDATVEVQVGEVLSGTDRLADGELRLKLRDGRLVLDPALVNLPGGSLRLSLAYDLKESEVDFEVAARIERFDYGVIARRFDRTESLRGLFSMNLDVSGRAPSLDSMMRNAHGRLDIAVWPAELRSRRFRIWSANMVLTLLPLIDPGRESQLNCVVGRFELRDGELSDNKLLIDTTTVRIRGSGHANLKTEELAFVFRPRAKGAGLFRLQTPLRVGGTFTDQRFYVDPRDVPLSVLRMAASPILVPIERLLLGPQPRDGADVCTDPLRAADP